MSSSEYALEVQKTLERGFDRVRQTTGAKQLQKRLYDRVHGELYEVGDHVCASPMDRTLLRSQTTYRQHLPDPVVQ